VIARAIFLAVLALCGCKVCPTDGTATSPIPFEQWTQESAAAIVSTLRHGDPCVEQWTIPTLSPASTTHPAEPCPPTHDPCAQCIAACDPATAACAASTAVYQAALTCADGQCATECSAP